ncbi:MAG TPA: pitrilysin family protein [Gemmatimonadaceae bacterium]|nr:pitrilysin family protein [Gemmatimonadaceae bacterium]
MPRSTTALAGGLLVLAASLGAQQPGRIATESYSLPNGLTVVLAEDHSAQVVAVDVWYNVGSRNERPGRTGFAHLFEHMMFQGSANVAKGEHMALLERAGASFNGSTTEDRTNYFEAVPSNRLNLALWLEADRMRSLAVTDSNFDNQREAVKEERRLRVDNQPYMAAIFEQTYGAFDSTSCFPYAHSIIGSMDDLNAAKTPDVKAFFDLYYAPNNATLVVTGDFQPAEAKRLIEQYFGGIPRGQAPPPVTCEQSYTPGLQRRRVVDEKANLPAVVQVYRVPAYDDADMPALELLATILGQGESSRLNRALARDAKVAAAAQTMLNPFGPRRGPGIFLFFTIANQGVAVDTLDRLLTEQIARIGREGITPEELTKAQNSYRADLIFGRQTALSTAEALHTARMFLGSPEAVNTQLERYMKVTADDIRRVAAKYLRPENAFILIITTKDVTS